jgi:hypothetical protein
MDRICGKFEILMANEIVRVITFGCPTMSGSPCLRCASRDHHSEIQTGAGEFAELRTAPNIIQPGIIQLHRRGRNAKDMTNPPGWCRDMVRFLCSESYVESDVGKCEK